MAYVEPYSLLDDAVIRDIINFSAGRKKEKQALLYPLKEGKEELNLDHIAQSINSDIEKIPNGICVFLSRDI